MEPIKNMQWFRDKIVRMHSEGKDPERIACILGLQTFVVKNHIARIDNPQEAVTTNVDFNEESK